MYIYMHMCLHIYICKFFTKFRFFNILYEITGLPGSVMSVVKSAAFEGGAKGPSMQSVVSILKGRGIDVESQSVKV
jgi:hypothetical protein